MADPGFGDCRFGAKLLANPRLMVLDNETASFNIVREIPYKEQSDASGGGTLTTTRFKNVGVELEVTPHITRDEMLRLRILPKFGVAEQQQFDKQGQPLVPVVNSRMLDTIALVKNNQTIVLGGLRKQETSYDIRKVPILGDIPLLGLLFQSKTETQVTNELLIFITPKIITQPVLTPTERKQFQNTEIEAWESPNG